MIESREDDALKTSERSITVTNELGLHARPASQLAHVASRFEATVEISNGETTANAKSILGVLTLAAPKGTTLELRASGSDAEDALEAICDLFQRQFDE